MNLSSIQKLEMKSDTRLYTLRPLKLGFEVIDFDLSKVENPAVIEQIKEDVRDYSLLVFRNQGNKALQFIDFEMMSL